jgi:hypothetical protein
MRIAIGLLLIIACFFGTLFFRRYDGTVIPYPALWYLSFIALGLLGLWLIASSGRRVKKMIEEAVNTEMEKFKLNAEKFELNFDNCEFKSGSFSHEIDDPNMSTMKFFAPGTLGSIETKITETVIQSYLVYTATINGTACKFISDSYPFDPTTLKFYVLNNNLKLYVDRFDSGKYLFDLNR